MPPRKKKGPPPGRAPANKGSITLKDTKSFPVTDRDDMEVECRACGQRSTYWKFRIHNMEAHYNITTTTDDDTVMDRRFYSRQLSELSKIAKIKTFVCPTEDCNSTYKSNLGLAFHLESCGKSEEEKLACFVECDVCHEKFSAPNLAWHKRSHMLEVIIQEDPGPVELQRESSKRQSAIKAREVIQNATDGVVDGEFGELGASTSTFTPTSTSKKCKAKKKGDTEEWSVPVESKRPSEAAVHDITYVASDFLDTGLKDDAKVWDKPVRNYIDPFREIEANGMKQLPPVESVMDYLPSVQDSVEFSVLQTGPFVTKKFRRLKIFESEANSLESQVIVHTGGSVTSLAWHPSGKYLAVSTLKGFKDKSDFKRSKSCIQIYEHTFASNYPTLEPLKLLDNKLKLVLIIAFNYGVINHLQWSSYWPHFDNPKVNCDSVGYLALACSDSTLRIISIKKSYFQLPPNVDIGLKRYRVYTKHPEVNLHFDKTLKVKSGECTKFDWHEDNRFIVVGYGSGHVALYDLETRSKLLTSRNEIGAGDYESIFYPIWIIRAHCMPVKGICFDASNPRYFVTGGKDRCIKVYDVDLRMEVQGRKVGLITDMCWIRGWIHVAVALDSANTKSSSTHNYVRFYNLGTMQGRPNCAQLNSVTSISFRNGLTLQAAEEGKISVTFFDQFWRECDFDRNKKKKNVVELVNTVLDDSSFEQFSKENMSKYWLKEVDEEPRITFNFIKHRLETQVLEEMSYEGVENFYRFYPYTRINKVAWSPSGDHYVVGYRNGLLLLMPFNFDATYN